MKIRIYSDLHLEFGRADPSFNARGDEDLVVLAGDIDVGSAGVAWAAATFPHVPVVYVLGNHEYYHHTLDTLVAECRARARGTNVQVLERDVFDVGGIRVLGCTLWTDYALFGAERRDEARNWADAALADYWCIRRQGGQLFTAAQSARAFVESAHWLDWQICQADRPLLVVTHHAPTAATIAPCYQGQISNAAFHSHADDLIRPPVRMWVHGHTHYNADLLHHGVRIVTNQWGYPSEDMLGFQRAGMFTFDAGGAS
ncbi:MAG: metallophosphoesterase [Pseudomonadota bacterium]|nr:metallophosphoesterase [Pseudomonadota bacterium]